jgi:NAD(P)-dependent dehydrogenase (short-subunit alcohol dehydrogenase family)
MPRQIADSVIVITGASTGIGRASALEFARSGATVVVMSRRQEVLRTLADHCEKLGGRALPIAADVTDQEAVDNSARRVVETFGRIDCWINNAAVTMFARLEQAPPAAYRKVIETNLFGYIHGARAVLPYFREQGSGVLINISSGVGRIGSPFISAYVASKFAIIGLTESLRMELRDAPNIHICTVLPGAIDTPLFQQGANFTGRAVKPIPPIYPAEEVAAALVELVRHPRHEIVIGNAAKLGLMTHAIAPGLTERIFAKRVEQKHFQDRPAPPTEGNLFTPMAEYHNVSGGWRVENEGARFPRKTLLGAVVAGTTLGLLIAWGRVRGQSFERLP